jgi:hypothetical protein
MIPTLHRRKGAPEGRLPATSRHRRLRRRPPPHARAPVPAARPPARRRRRHVERRRRGDEPAVPFLRPSVARARLAALGIDASTPARLFAALEARHWMFDASGPRSFHATIRAIDPDDPEGAQKELAHAAGLSFTQALTVALCVAIEAYPAWVPQPWVRPTPDPDPDGAEAGVPRRRDDDAPAH